MLEKINRWLLQVFSSSDVNKLLLVLAAVCAVLWLFIGELAPLLGAVLIAYVLEGAVEKLIRRWHFSRTMAVTIVIVAAIFSALAAAYALPAFLLQLRELGDQLPQTMGSLEGAVQKLNEILPDDLALDKSAITEQGSALAAGMVTYVLNNLFSYAGNIASLFVYAVLLPLLVFFLLRDKTLLVEALCRFIPKSPIFAELWQRVDVQLGSYIRGKIIEAVLVWAATWIVFQLLRVEYALALTIMVGLSVFVPFVGAVAVTFPVVLFGYLQFGWSSEFAWMMIAYTVIQTIDAQVLVPLLFSSVINIHPVAVFCALIFFGNLWGVWGVFFAIPLAAVIKSILLSILHHHSPDST